MTTPHVKDRIIKRISSEGRKLREATRSGHFTSSVVSPPLSSSIVSTRVPVRSVVGSKSLVVGSCQKSDGGGLHHREDIMYNITNQLTRTVPRGGNSMNGSSMHCIEIDKFRPFRMSLM